ncbi:MAG: helix-turn-helix transcriptional regulator [Lachnospiraceae bacterium]|nr:helix-turn-helix transcriptional regulator [Lachnospiraceae bacterium]MBP3458913.1 helix-turn-helix transcriptional regulator [Lachnospiraceae bacterium]
MEVLIWQAREKQGISLEQLSKMTGISRSTLNNIENGKTDPSFPQLEKIAKFFNCKIGDIVKSDYL